MPSFIPQVWEVVGWDEDAQCVACSKHKTALRSVLQYASGWAEIGLSDWWGSEMSSAMAVSIASWKEQRLGSTKEWDQRHQGYPFMGRSKSKAEVSKLK